MYGTARQVRSWLLAVCGGAAVCSGVNRVAAEQFPYVAYVARPDAIVRSGPGQDHYPTDKLRAGYAVEVYRHDGERWCAIRPPEGQFCLVAASDVRVLADQTAEVIAQRAVARVGSRLTPSANAVQVVLQVGEILEVRRGRQSGDPWIHVAPPAGEFRWIDAKELSRRPPLEFRGQPGPGSVGQAWPGSRWRAPNLSDSSPPPAGEDAFAHLVDQPGQSTRAHNLAGNGPPARTDEPTPVPVADEPIEILPGSPADLAADHGGVPASPDEKETVAIPTTAIGGPAGGKPPGADGATEADDLASGRRSPPLVKLPGNEALLPVNERVAELQWRLSQAVAEPPAAWDLSAVRAETAALLAQEQDTVARRQFRDLLERISVFEQVRTRYLAPAVAPMTAVSSNDLPAAEARQPAAGSPPPDDSEAPLFTGETRTVRDRIADDVSQGMIGRVRDIDPSVGTSNGDTADTSATVAADDITPTDDDPFDEGAVKYDAVGTLKPVVSRRSGAPRYALVDDEGDVAAFVAAAPDINLARYIGRRVGVNGTRGFIPDYRRSHVTATRIRTLGETKRR